MLIGNEEKMLPNFRDLGGFTDSRGNTARMGRYFRSGMPSCFDCDTEQFLRQKKISVIIDFRSDGEKKKSGNGESSFSGEYLSIPYYDEASVRKITEMEQNKKYDWYEIYEKILESGKEWIKKVFITFAVVQGNILFHCASGKDRTGVIAALLLELTGADEVTVMIDYVLSQYTFEEKEDPFYQTEPQTMKKVLEYLEENYGGAEAYLKQIGVNAYFLDRVKKKFFS